jgi:ABC-2 type transport system ATP-binding protein
MSHPPPAVVVRDLTKTYGALRAVDGLTFTIERGEVFALLGPNGAGKSTTVEILEGYRRADGGSVSVLGFDPIRQSSELKSHIGVMLQEGGLYPTITPIEALNLFATYYEHPRAPQELLRLVGLQDAQATRYRRLSGGQKQRLALALALLPLPELIFLDEPTAGLDPQARRDTWEIITGLKESGTTVLLTTHYLEEAERLADRVAIMRAGALIALGTPRELTQRSQSVVRLRTLGAAAIDVLSSLPAAAGVRSIDDETYMIDTTDTPALLAQVTDHLRKVGTPIVELRVGYGSLEDVFLELTGEPLQ